MGSDFQSSFLARSTNRSNCSRPLKTVPNGNRVSTLACATEEIKSVETIIAKRRIGLATKSRLRTGSSVGAFISIVEFLRLAVVRFAQNDRSRSPTETRQTPCGY